MLPLWYHNGACLPEPPSVQVDDPDVIKFLLSTGIIHHCLRIMGHGGDLSKTVGNSFFFCGCLLAEGVFLVVGVRLVDAFLRCVPLTMRTRVQVATFILQRVLMMPNGLQFICQTPERFFAVSRVLGDMVGENPQPRLLKHIVRCYQRLTEHQK